MWHFDAQTGNCKRFVYGGCDGNGNRFETEEECMAFCFAADDSPPPSPDMEEVVDNHQDELMEPRDSGSYGSGAGQQQLEGNGLTTTFPSKCSLPIKSGMCLAFFRKYAFDSESGSCKQFTYGGCGGNENRFDSLEECQSTCQQLSDELDEIQDEENELEIVKTWFQNKCKKAEKNWTDYDSITNQTNLYSTHEEDEMAGADEHVRNVEPVGNEQFRDMILQLEAAAAKRSQPRSSDFTSAIADEKTLVVATSSEDVCKVITCKGGVITSIQYHQDCQIVKIES